MSTLKNHVDVRNVCPICAEKKAREDLPLCSKCTSWLHKPFIAEAVKKFDETREELLWNPWLISYLTNNQRPKVQSEKLDLKRRKNELDATIAKKVDELTRDEAGDIGAIKTPVLKAVLQQRLASKRKLMTDKEWVDQGGNKLYAELKKAETKLAAINMAIELATNGPQLRQIGDHLDIQVHAVNTDGRPDNLSEDMSDYPGPEPSPLNSVKSISAIAD